MSVMQSPPLVLMPDACRAGGPKLAEWMEPPAIKLPASIAVRVPQHQTRVHPGNGAGLGDHNRPQQVGYFDTSLR